MVIFTILSLHLFAYVLFIIQPIGMVVAYDKSSNVNEFTVKNHRTRMRQNYIVQKATNNKVLNNMDDSGVSYASESVEPEASPEELPALIVDYANMIRNDIILLDNSVQTRTRKRGNYKTEKHNQVVQDVPCSCEEDGKKPLFLGDEYFPRTLETRQCNERLCPSPYGCRIRSHNVTVLKRKKYLDELSQEELPEELKWRWVAVKKLVTIGCMCSKGYIDVPLLN